jgi:hypothetical protein
MTRANYWFVTVPNTADVGTDRRRQRLACPPPPSVLLGCTWLLPCCCNRLEDDRISSSHKSVIKTIPAFAVNVCRHVLLVFMCECSINDAYLLHSCILRPCDPAKYCSLTSLCFRHQPFVDLAADTFYTASVIKRTFNGQLATAMTLWTTEQLATCPPCCVRGIT